MRALLAGLALIAATASAQDAQTMLHLLDYIGVDYAEAVDGGRLKNEDEYQEMLEFAARVTTQARELGENPAKAAIVRDAQALEELVRDKAPPPAVADSSRELRWSIVRAYRLAIAPLAPPDLALGAKLYAQHCASCHGPQGRGDGPAGKGLQPAPSNFHDVERMAQRSAYGLYNTITLGVAGTGMAAFKQLSEAERWALAFHVGTVGSAAERIADGERRWKSGEARSAFPSLDNVATLSAREVEARFGEPAVRVHHYLRAHPEAVKPAPVSFARRKIAEAAAAHAAGNIAAARQAAITAYLEGFELAERSLANVAPDLVRGIEKEMMDLRAAIERGEGGEALAERARRVDSLLVSAQEKLGEAALSPAAAFSTSLFILLREGLEAILVLAAIIAFVIRTGRRDALPWIHAGWIGALALGAATWIVASYVIDVSGANRELTEGITALAAATVLLYVGYWLHDKSHAAAWTAFLREHVGRALGRRTLWAMAGVSFLAVYREMFEVVLFYQALWAQAGAGGRGAVLGGMASAAVLLAILAFLILKYSVRLPLALFFRVTSGLIALLAVVFTGHGIAALQEAGVIDAARLDFDAIPLLGIYPTTQSLAGQALMLVLITLSFGAAGRGRRHSAAGT